MILMCQHLSTGLKVGRLEWCGVKTDLTEEQQHGDWCLPLQGAHPFERNHSSEILKRTHMVPE